MEAILLAGGLGTRLHQVTGDLYPKCLAEVAGKPFIHYMIQNLAANGIEHFVVAVSHHADQVEASLNAAFPELDIEYSLELEPLGTGGAIKQALAHCRSDQVLVLNADSFMEFDLQTFVAFAKQRTAGLAIVGTEVDDVSRFGAADIDENHRLRGFFEKGRHGKGVINSGIYLIDRCHPRLGELKGKFSFETEVLADPAVEVYVHQCTGLFFDIGTPDDFVGAQRLVALNRALFDAK